MSHLQDTGLPESAIQALCGLFSQWPAIESVWLYGSRAKGNWRPGSDIDLSIRDNGLSLSDLMALENRIDDLLLPWMVDLSRYADIDNPQLREHIDRVGLCFYQRATEHAANP
ncbi:nucleotidyltransferase family protein [Halopseudomonas yangmingensis]|uniref:Predicted nucleotidyltransferase n=1 Tax=Halopseudomonas yangmingensis TaxID=1720063 RepID=A0A1I4TWZ6_9GAMM|nr:nucleotidyltransferase domain-containing protein [Halopseudomonas yangmingensis]SFM81179.1 Predicted nucleotidyltransferase [Halopseudomonas yangmingensis]